MTVRLGNKPANACCGRGKKLRGQLPGDSFSVADSNIASVRRCSAQLSSAQVRCAPNLIFRVRFWRSRSGSWTSRRTLCPVLPADSRASRAPPFQSSRARDRRPSRSRSRSLRAGSSRLTRRRLRDSSFPSNFDSGKKNVGSTLQRTHTHTEDPPLPTASTNGPRPGNGHNDSGGTIAATGDRIAQGLADLSFEGGELAREQISVRAHNSP